MNRLTLILLSLIALGGCAGTDDDVTGSESHFVRCDADEDCPTGTCEASYCEVDGQRITNLGTTTASETSGTSTEDQSNSDCEVLSRTPKTLAELGLSADSLNLAEATLPFTWDATDWEQYVTIEPSQAETEITLSVSVLEETAEHIERKVRAGVGGDPFCESIDQVRMRYQVRTSDGTFDESGEVLSTLGKVPQTLSFSVQSEDLAGSLKVTPVTQKATASFQFELWWPEQELSGQVNTTVNFPAMDNSGASSAGTVGRSGRFSRTGCGPNYYHVGATDQFGSRTLGEELAALAMPTALLGTWDNGEATDVTLTMTTDVMSGCREGTRLELPVSVALSSADGKLRDLVLGGTFHWLRSEGGASLVQRQVTATESLECANAGPWPLQNVSCADFAAVSATLVFSTYPGGTTPDSGSLELFVFEQANVERNVADDVTTLQLAPMDAL